MWLFLALARCRHQGALGPAHADTTLEDATSHGKVLEKEPFKKFSAGEKSGQNCAA